MFETDLVSATTRRSPRRARAAPDRRWSPCLAIGFLAQVQRLDINKTLLVLSAWWWWGLGGTHTIQLIFQQQRNCANNLCVAANLRNSLMWQFTTAESYGIEFTTLEPYGKEFTALEFFIQSLRFYKSGHWFKVKLLLFVIWLIVLFIFYLCNLQYKNYNWWVPAASVPNLINRVVPDFKIPHITTLES